MPSLRVPRVPRLRPAVAAAALAALGSSIARAQETAPPAKPTRLHLHHDVSVRVDPSEHRISGTDTLDLPAALRTVPLRVRLHGNLTLTAADPAWEVRPAGETKGADAEESALVVPLRTWEIRPSGGATTWPVDGAVPLRFEGRIHHPVVTGSEEYARSFSGTPGTIGDEGVVLSGATWWLPVIERRPDAAPGSDLITFTLTANVPGDWDVVSQGRRTRRETVEGGRVAPGSEPASRRIVTWDCAHPMDEAYLIAAKFTEYERAAGGITAHAFLRAPDPAMASKYLEATAQYIEMYRKLLGPYPFEKFALVENFWETGYGMPSFTLLGPQVIRLPFILHSSYPHEILHNWWGNSVYVDWSKGNWCEGLTAYLADHLIREGQGRGAEYRNDTLKSYRNYVGTDAGAKRDFPLTEFRSRHSAATQAVGYGKCLMLWHMLRVRMGDEKFVQALQRFYAKHRFRIAAWSDIEPVFSEVAGEDLKPFFTQWTTRTGALHLRIGSVAGHERATVIEVEQTQGGAPFDGVVVPVAVTLEGVADAVMTSVRLEGGRGVLTVPTDGKRVVRIDVDPEFDVFRALDQSETPPTLSEMFGAEHVTLIVPAKDAPLAAEWRTFAQTWASGGKDVVIVAEDEIEALPAGRAVWALGAANRFGPKVSAALASAGGHVDEKEARFGSGEAVPRGNHSFVYVARHPADPKAAAGWVGTDVAAAIPGLARKLPHYGKYSYLAFAGEAPDNVVKGVWAATDSPLVQFVGEGMKTRPARGKLPPRMPLARLAPVFDPAKLAASVAFLSDDAQEGRGVGTEGLDRCANWLAVAFRDAGLKPDDVVARIGNAETAYFDSWNEENGPGGKPVTLRNVIGIIPGTNPAMKGECVVVAAHYDHLGRGWPDAREGMAGQIHNGADDNASGVAALLEVARILGPDAKPARTIVFVAFSGEEWGLKGAKRFLATRLPHQRPTSIVNLDTVGRLGDKKLLVLGAGTASEWRHIAMGIGFTTGVESTCVANDPGGSDQLAFHAAGIPGVQLFTGPHADYHRPSDDAAKVDIDGLVKIATWVREAVAYLADRPEPLTSSLDGAPKKEGAGGNPAPAAPGTGEARRASLGTMPDFEFPGPGVKVGSVIDGSPAQIAGIAAGDVIIAFDGHDVADLRAYSTLLKARKPGETVKVRILRDGKTVEVETKLVAR